MTRRNLATALQSTLAASLLVSVSVFPTGCKEEEPPPAPVIRDTPKPRQVRVDEIAGMLTLDPKVNASVATQQDCSREELEAVLQFASDFAAGDVDALNGHLDELGREVLNDLVTNQEWDDAINEDLRELKVVDCQKSDGSTRALFNLALAGGETVDLQWTLRQRGDLWVFSPYAELPDEPVVTEEQPETGTEEGDRRSRRGRDRNRDLPSNDPRRRVPGGPGGN